MPAKVTHLSAYRERREAEMMVRRHQIYESKRAVLHRASQERTTSRWVSWAIAAVVWTLCGMLAIAASAEPVTVGSVTFDGERMAYAQITWDGSTPITTITMRDGHRVTLRGVTPRHIHDIRMKRLLDSVAQMDTQK